MARTRFASTLPSALPSGLSWVRPSLRLRLFVAASPLLPEAYLVEGDLVEGDRVKGDLVEGDRVEGDRVAQFPDCPLTGRRRRPKKKPRDPCVGHPLAPPLPPPAAFPPSRRPRYRWAIAWRSTPTARSPGGNPNISRLFRPSNRALARRGGASARTTTGRAAGRAAAGSSG
ncbi:hypothetical protein CLOP_g17091 [Closterium sp. NIES-67]|nr:hypothetical protein CLOP_g17091 [Closterium sp. NIES-67]